MTAAHRVRTGPALPAVVPRILLAVLVAAGGGILTDVLLWQILAAASGLVAVIAPPLRTAYLGIVFVVLGLLAHDPSLWRTSLAILVVHGIHVLASLTLVVPLRATVTVRALRPTAFRFVVVQAIAQAAAPLAAGLPSEAGIAWLAPVGSIALAVVAGALLVATRRARE